VSVVASEIDRLLLDKAGGLESVVDGLPASAVLLVGEGIADDREAVENDELAGDKSDGTTVSSKLSTVVTLVFPLLLELEDRVQDAKAARCSGRQP